MIDDECQRWETLADIEAVFLRAGRHVPSPSRMAHWRRMELLPKVEQESVEGVRGSRTLYPVGYANRLLEITLLLKRKKKLADVAFELWWRGREVGDRWWRPALVQAAAELDYGIKLSRRLFAPVDDDEEVADRVFDELDRREYRKSPFGLIAQRLKPSRRVFDFASILARIATGSFRGFGDLGGADATNRDAQQQDARLDLEVVQKGFGFHQARKQTVNGVAPGYSEVLPSALVAISDVHRSGSYGEALELASDADIAACRDYVRNCFTVASALRDALSSRLGRNALGLKLLALFAQAVPGIRAIVVVAWLRFSNATDFAVLSADKVKELHSMTSPA